MTTKDYRDIFITLIVIALIGLLYHSFYFNSSFKKHVDFKEINNQMQLEREINELQSELFIEEQSFDEFAGSYKDEYDFYNEYGPYKEKNVNNLSNYYLVKAITFDINGEEQTILTDLEGITFYNVGRELENGTNYIVLKGENTKKIHHIYKATFNFSYEDNFLNGEALEYEREILLKMDSDIFYAKKLESL